MFHDWTADVVADVGKFVGFAVLHELPRRMKLRAIKLAAYNAIFFAALLVLA
jgi:hypothetical protein